MEENPKPRRRWFRFSLRTLLVLVTLGCVLCGYLGWAMNWKRQRHEFLKTPHFQSLGVQKSWDLKRYWELSSLIGLWLVGEDFHEAIFLEEPEERQIHEGRRLFPEADVLCEDGQPCVAATQD